MANFLKDIIIASVMGEEAKSWPTFTDTTLTRSSYLTASEASKCLRELSFSKIAEINAIRRGGELSDDEYNTLLSSQGATSPDGYFQRGHNVEAWIVDKLEAAADDHEIFMFMGDEQVSFYDTRTRISGTPDGFLYNTETKEFWLLEFKSVGSQVYSPRYGHVKQCQVNMGLIKYISQDSRPRYSKKLLKMFTDRGVELVEGKLPPWSGTKLLYVQSSNYFDIREFNLEYDAQIFVKTATKAKRLFSGEEDQIEQLARPATLPAEGISQNKCVFCNHKAACRILVTQQEGDDMAKEFDKSMGVASLPPFKSDKTRAELVKEVATFATLDYASKKLAEEIKKLKPEVVNFVLNHFDGKLEGDTPEGVYHIAVRESPGRSNLDKNAMGDDGIDLDKYTKIGAPFYTTTVKFSE